MSHHIDELLEGAAAQGELGASSLQALQVDNDYGAQIEKGMGLTPEDVPSAEVVLVTLMPDDSGSIRFAGNSQAVCDGHNQVIDALGSSKQQADVLVHNRYLNGCVLYPYTRVGSAVAMDGQNYDPNQGTPLYDQMVVLLGTVLAKTQEFEDCGVPVRSVTLIITDGGDCSSRRQSAATVRPIVEDMLRSERHIVAAMGIDDGQTDFCEVFREMGIRDEWILLPGNSASEIRAAFQVFSQSAVNVSQGAQLSAPATAIWN